jgi:O-antigen/teichoic acid export membrane protein
MSSGHFVGRASWTLVDQCVVSGGNFLLNVLLARVLSQEDYGYFALFLGAIFMLRTIDYSFISYPVSLRLAVATDVERPRLLGNTALATLGLSLVLVVAMACGAALLQADDILIPACLCYLCWQVHETPRRVLLGDMRFRAAVAGDAVAYVGQVLLIASLLWLDSVTLTHTLYAMSATFVAGSVVHSCKLRPARPDLREAARLVLEYASVGKWSVVSYQLVLLRVQLFPWILAAVAGTAATASFQAAMNIVGVMNPVVFGIGNAIPQVAAHAHASGGVRDGWRAAYRYLLFGLVPITLMCGTTVLFPELLLEVAYGSASPYLVVAVGLQLLALSSLLDYLAEVMSKTLLGVQAGKQAFFVNVTAVLVALALAVAFLGTYGVLGACASLVVANLVRVAGGALALSWLIRREKTDGRRGAAEDRAPASAGEVVAQAARH